MKYVLNINLLLPSCEGLALQIAKCLCQLVSSLVCSLPDICSLYVIFTDTAPSGFINGPRHRYVILAQFAEFAVTSDLSK